MIHQVKTKEIKTVRVLWISDLEINHRILRSYELSLRSLIRFRIEWKQNQAKQTVFHQISQRLEFVKNTPLHLWRCIEN